jgi:hypothetical protein
MSDGTHPDSVRFPTTASIQAPSLDERFPGLRQAAHVGFDDLDAGRRLPLDEVEAWIGYDTDLKAAVQTACDAASQAEGVLDTPAPAVRVNELGQDDIARSRGQHGRGLLQ